MTAAQRPRLGFLGVGWIGRHRMRAILDSGVAEAAAIADPSHEMVAEALRLAPHATVVNGLDAMLALDLDGVVIATPSALHAEQSARALESGAAVFCQKPLGRTAAEARTVVDAARAADRLLCVDLSYRHTAAMQCVRDLVRGGELGRVHGVDLVFHNAYGPDKAWFRDRSLSGGGCVMDLGVHMVDLALWTLDFPTVRAASGTLFAGGERLGPGPECVEDYALAILELEGGAAVRLACSWNLHAGRDAEISAAFYGTTGGAALRNVGGSFYNFVGERFHGTVTQVLTTPPDDWGGRAAVAWASRLVEGGGFDPEAEQVVEVAQALDLIYGR